MRSLLSLLLGFLVMSTAAAEPEYSFSFDGKPFQPGIVFSVYGSPDQLREGDVVRVPHDPIVLGAPGDYAFSRGEGGLLLSYSDGPPELVYTELTGESPPPTRGEIRKLRGVSVGDWKPEFEELLTHLELERCYVELALGFSFEESTLAELPPLPSQLRYLSICERVSPGYKSLKGLRRLTNLRLLSLSLMTKEVQSVDGSWISHCRELRVLEIGQASQLVAPEKLGELKELREVRSRLAEDIQGVEFVRKFPGLEALDVSLSLGLRDLSALGGHPSLRRVKADKSPVEALPTVALPNLTSLSVMGGALPPEVVAAFLELHPGKLSYSWTEELTAAIRSADKVRVRTGGTCHRRIGQEKTLFTTSDLNALLGTIDLDERQSGGHCMCCGGPSFEFYERDTLIATVGFHHGQALRWSRGWPGDGVLTEASSGKLVDWLATHGVEGPKLEIEAARARRKRWEEAWKKASEGLPESVKESLLARSSDPTRRGSASLIKSLEEAFPEPRTQILALFRVLGSEGPWNPSNVYEVSASDALGEYSQTDLRGCLQQSLTSSNPRERRGAVRFWTRSRKLDSWVPTAEEFDLALNILQRSPSAWVRQYALFSLARHRDLIQIKHLTYALSDSDPTVRRTAIVVAGRAGLKGLAPELMQALEESPRVLRPALDPPEEDSVEPIGAELSEQQLAAIALGLLNHRPAYEELRRLPSAPGRDVGLALMGDLALLKEEHFSPVQANQPLVLGAVEAVVRGNGRYGLGWAVNCKLEYGRNEEEVVRSLVSTLMLRQGPGGEELIKCSSLEELQSWYDSYGSEYEGL